MTVEEERDRMRDALLVLAGNLNPGGDFRPLSFDMCVQCADFAQKVAAGDPVPEFDNSR